MSWETLKTTFMDGKIQHKNKRKSRRKSNARNQYKNIFLKKTNELNRSLKYQKICSNINDSDRRLFKSDSESDGEIQDVLANICTNDNYNIPSNKSVLQLNKENNSYCSNKQYENKNWLKPKELCSYRNLNESAYVQLNETIVEDHSSDDNKSGQGDNNVNFNKNILIEDTSSPEKHFQSDNKEIISSQKSELFSKNDEFNIEFLSSTTENNIFNSDTKIETQISTDNEDEQILEGERELDLLIRDLQSYTENEKRIRVKKGGYVEKFRNILRSNRSNYYFWKNEYENGIIESESEIIGEIIDIKESFTQTLLEISQHNEYVYLLIDSNNKIYKGQHFSIGTKVICSIESQPLILNDGKQIHLGVNKIMKLK